MSDCEHEIDDLPKVLANSTQGSSNHRARVCLVTTLKELRRFNYRVAVQPFRLRLKTIFVDPGFQSKPRAGIQRLRKACLTYEGHQ
jgi:hypothetical protein